MVDLKFVVAGTGRCGTNYMANLITSMGSPCGHESVFTTRGWEWAKEVMHGPESPQNSEISRWGTILSEGPEIVGDSSYASAPFLGRLDAMVIHLVRNPMNVVASFIGSGFRHFSEPWPVDHEDLPEHFAHEKFKYDHLPDLGAEMPQLDRACLFYLSWNEMIEASGAVDIRHRVEDEPTTIKKLFSHRGDCYDDRLCNSFSHTSAPWGLQQVSSTKIRGQIKDIMKRYGYKRQLLMD